MTPTFPFARHLCVLGALVLVGCTSGGAPGRPSTAPPAPSAPTPSPTPPRRTEPSPTAYVLAGVASLSDDVVERIHGCLPSSWIETRASRNDIDYAYAFVGSNAVVRIVQIEMKAATEDERAEIRQLFPKTDTARRVEVRIRGGDFAKFGEDIGRETERAFPPLDEKARAALLGPFAQPALDDATRAKEAGLWPEAARKGRAAAGLAEAAGDSALKARAEQLRAEIKTEIREIAAVLGGKALEHWTGERGVVISKLTFADVGQTGIVGYVIEDGRRRISFDLESYRVVRVPEGLKIRVQVRHIAQQQDLFMLKLDIAGLISPAGEFAGESTQKVYTTNATFADSTTTEPLAGRLVAR